MKTIALAVCFRISITRNSEKSRIQHWFDFIISQLPKAQANLETTMQNRTAMKPQEAVSQCAVQSNESDGNSLLAV